MQPVIVLVGRPNVGKSTLFNALTRSRDALVADMPGLTRDRQYGVGESAGRRFIVIDTGGLGVGQDELDGLMAAQTRRAMEDADIIALLVDAREGLVGADEQIANELRRLGKAVLLVVNKTDGLDERTATAEFHQLGLGEPLAVSAAHNRGVNQIADHVLAQVPAAEEPLPDARAGPAVAVIGRPNVGKSTLVNRLVGDQRVVAYDSPGTTRDSVLVPFERDGRHYVLIDTAGVRRRGRIRDKVEKFSVIKALEAIERARVVIVVLDARQGVADQDLSLIGHVLEAGRALVVAVNKWDGLEQGQREQIRTELERRLGFLSFAELHFISALHGSGLGKLLEAVDRAHEAAMAKLSTPELTRILSDAVEAHQPPAVRGRRIKLRYAHQGGQNPPVIVIHGTQTESLPAAYRRYLANVFSQRLGLRGTPLHIELRSAANPYAGRRNPLTERQKARRRRLMKHVKRKR
jgi:GTP-binding protein